MRLGSTIAKLRKKKGLHQKELAERCNISTVYVSLIENDKKEPNLSVLKEISECIGIPLPILLFMSLSEEDIPTEKKEAFNILFEPASAVITNMFLEPLENGHQD